MPLSRHPFLRGLPAGFRQLVVAQQGQFQPLEHVTQLEPVGLQSIARCRLFVDIREAQPIHLQRFEQLGSHLAPLHGNAELVAQILHERM